MLERLVERNENLFRNIGTKIKGITILSFFIGAAVSVLIGLIALIDGVVDAYDFGETMLSIFIGIIIAAAGIFISWLSCLITYGFGELVENSSWMASSTHTSSNSKKTPPKQSKKHNTEVVDGIAYTEYECPNCREGLSLTEDDLKSSSLICPFCCEQIKRSELI